MGRTVRLGRLAWVTGAVALLAATAQAADKSLEDRVRVLEQKMGKPDAEHSSMTERISAVEKDVLATKDALAEKIGIDVHGFVSTSYNYNFNDPDNRTNFGRVFDTDTNTFALDAATLQLSRNKEDEALGFGMSLDFGKTAEVVGSVTSWNHSHDPVTGLPDGSESTNSFELREAFLTYKLPFLEGVTLKAGKFVTLLGAEIIDNWNNHNTNISRSISFGYGIPFTHTGLLLNAPIAEMVTLDIGVVNGFDSVIDNNDGKTLLAGIGITPVDVFSMYISGTYGPEQNERGGSKRGTTTVVATIKPLDELSFVLEGTYGNETDLVGATGHDNADWYGGAGYINVQAMEDLAFCLRAEVFDDPDGVRGLNATIWEFTPTVAYTVSEGLLVRAEYRHDDADKKVFFKEGHSSHSQDTLAAQIIYSF